MPQQKRVLVIEDDESISDSLKTFLEQNAFAVETASDGETGSRLAISKMYDLVLLDNLLPKKLGFQVCQEIRSAGKRLPIIVMSVCSDLSNKLSLFENGADDYVIKPFPLEELLARMEAVLRRTQSTAVLLSTSNLTINTATRVVKRAGREIPLTKTEFEILLLLMKHKHRVLTRDIIIEHVWQTADAITPHTLDSHITNLRQKLMREGERSLIQTIAGIGYRLS